MLGRSLLQRVAIKSAISQTLVNIRNRVSVVSSIRCPSVQRSFSTLGPKTTYTAVRDTNFVTLHSDRADSADAVQKFPLVWLRDNCQCAQCFHHESSSRIIDWTRFDVNVQPETIEFDNATGNLNISWSDAHRTVHQHAWLSARQFAPAKQHEYLRNGYRPARQPWTSRTFADIGQQRPDGGFRFDDILRTDAALHDWLQHLAVHGVAFISGAPAADQSVCRQLADRVAFIRPTHYGHEFHVRNKPDTHNVAYLSTPLQMHTDLPYYEYAPGVNLLHCVEQAHAPDGAFNLLADGLTVAERLRREWPQHYERLTRIEVDWLDVGVDGGFRFHTRFRAPVICLDGDGVTVRRINHSVPQRDSRFTCAADEVDGWYRAQAKFVELIYGEAVRFKTRPGDILTFDNARLVHGRTGYEDVAGNVRHVVGAYLDWDEIYSRLRVLADAAEGRGEHAK